MDGGGTSITSGFSVTSGVGVGVIEVTDTCTPHSYQSRGSRIEFARVAVDLTLV
jgi:hypothetical protein